MAQDMHTLVKQAKVQTHLLTRGPAEAGQIVESAGSWHEPETGTPERG